VPSLPCASRISVWSSSRASTTTVNSYSTTVVAAPPVVGGFGYGFGMPFFGGWGYRPTFLMPFPFFGGLLQIVFLLVIVNVVFSIVKVGRVCRLGPWGVLLNRRGPDFSRLA
jgi:uncharacterized membrane protein